MSINMADVKEIINNANNKEVVKIEDGLGNVLWQKAAAKVLTSITLANYTTSLNRNAAFSFGGTVTAHYSDSSTADVTADTTFSGYDMSTSGTYTVTASYTEDSTTVTATYSLTVNPIWTTTYNNSTGKKILKLGGTDSPKGKWTLGSVPVNISNLTSKIKLTYKVSVEVNAYDGEGSGTKPTTNDWAKLIFDQGGNNITVSPKANTNLTQQFNYTQGKNILYAYYYPNRSSSTAGQAKSRWYRNSLASVSIADTAYWGKTRIFYIIITKVEEYY